jgi:hypothetical protein
VRLQKFLSDGFSRYNIYICIYIFGSLESVSPFYSEIDSGRELGGIFSPGVATSWLPLM